MDYIVLTTASAEKDIRRLSDPIRSRVNNKIISLENNPRPRGSKKLTGRDEYRIRVGDYRILYVIDDNNRVVTIRAVGHRHEIYNFN